MIKIEREDMLELTRRMTVKRTSMTRIAGSYLDAEGFVDGTFNTSFLKLSGVDKSKNLELAKAIPYSATNHNLKMYQFPQGAKKPGGIWQLLMAMKSCGLKNDALMDTFYELIGTHYQSDHDYAVFVFHDCYDVPVKTADHERQWESEEIFEYLICAICPVTGDYEPGEPECGFLFPAFVNRSGDESFINIFHADPEHPHGELNRLLGVE